MGRIIGIAIFHGHYLDGGFTLPFYKQLLAKPVTLNDLENVDPELHRSLVWLLWVLLCEAGNFVVKNYASSKFCFRELCKFKLLYAQHVPFWEYLPLCTFLRRPYTLTKYINLALKTKSDVSLRNALYNQNKSRISVPIIWGGKVFHNYQNRNLNGWKNVSGFEHSTAGFSDNTRLSMYVASIDHVQITIIMGRPL